MTASSPSATCARSRSSAWRPPWARAPRLFPPSTPISPTAAPLRRRKSDGRQLLAPEHDPQGHAQRARLRGVPEDRRAMGAPAPLPYLRPCRLLRLFAEQARHQALSPHQAPDHRGLRSARRLGLLLRRRRHARSGVCFVSFSLLLLL